MAHSDGQQGQQHGCSRGMQRSLERAFGRRKAVVGIVHVELLAFSIRKRKEKKGMRINAQHNVPSNHHECTCGEPYIRGSF